MAPASPTPPTATDDLRIASVRDVTPPAGVRAELPAPGAVEDLVARTRAAIHRILTGQDDRVLLVVGPCSIHDEAAALEYAGRLAALRRAVADPVELLMRVYFEKPRTTVGWKGFVNDPDLDGRFDINRGLRLARRLLLEINGLGVPAGTEYLEIITPQYINDLVSWGAIGARTTESQVHRELASGLSCPVGFKNGTDGDVQIAVDAVGAAAHPHQFLSLTKEGHSAIFETRGNADCHVILRGGRQPNYHREAVQDTAEMLERAGLPRRILIDCSHANSRKNPLRQPVVAGDVAHQIADGDDRIMGVMLESHLVGGRQARAPGQPLVYGQSITDGCLGWDATEPVVQELAEAVLRRRQRAES
jgi:3-deoxy-7-phosphoheptulonate synthase